MTRKYFDRFFILLSLPMFSTLAQVQSQGAWEGTIFDLGSNRICNGSLEIKKKGLKLELCFKYDCKAAGGGEGIEKWSVLRKENELMSKGKRIGFIKSDRILIEETYPLNNDYQIEFKEGSSKIDILSDSAIGDYKGTLLKSNNSSTCL